MQPTSQFRSVCLTEQRHRESRGRGPAGLFFCSGWGGFWVAGGQLAHDGSFEGRTEFYKPYKMLPEAMNEIIAAMWIILTDRFLACVCVGVCVCVCVCVY